MSSHPPRRCTVYRDHQACDEIVLAPAHDEQPAHVFDPLRVPLHVLVRRDLVCASPELPLASVVRLVAHHRIGCLPVVDTDRRPLGLVTRLDLVEQLDQLLQGQPVAAQTTARDLMVPQPVVVEEHASLTTAAGMIGGDQLGHVLVVTRDGVLVGVVAARDMLRWLDDNAAFERRPRRFATGTGAPPWHPLEG